MPVRVLPKGAVSGEEINALRAAAWDGVGEIDWTPVFARSFGQVVVRDGERLVGFVNLVWDGGAHVFLLDTVVALDHQRQGVGTALVKQAIALARTSGAEWLHVDYEDHLDGFYRGCGFEPVRAGLVWLPEGESSPG